MGSIIYKIFFSSWDQALNKSFFFNPKYTLESSGEVFTDTAMKV